ncbi:MAG: type I-E CRISPR-associated protein Cse1/CasA [Hyphomonadaceae bacterium]|nr:type I-E CRISPR-associated protein Cse1/CasA [Hyphomonadaceae bacterium]
MNLNLISDPWIPVRTRQGKRVIAPHEIADPDVLFPDWPRPDFNLNTLELLIGLVSLAVAPQEEHEWYEIGAEIDPSSLAKHLAPLTPFFNLLGDGPYRFMQDLDDIEGSANPAEALLIDAAGENTSKKNADLMVHRGRHEGFDLPTAAIALYTLQNSAPSGGAGNRTSLRGGGPLTTLVIPNDAPTLWDIVWTNVPIGTSCQDEASIKAALPWCRPTRTSEKGTGEVTSPPNSEKRISPEVFFGMPRRIRLRATEGLVTGWAQVPWGTNYSHFIHPLSPYYANEKGKPHDPPLLPIHPKPGTLSYRDWLGLSLRRPPGEGGEVARCVQEAEAKLDRDDAQNRLLVAGWSMKNMTPVDFQWSEIPLQLGMSPDAEDTARQMVDAASLAASFLVKQLGVALNLEAGDAAAIAPEREAFFHDTQSAFEEALLHLARGGDADQLAQLKAEWFRTIERAALRRFDAAVLPGLALRDISHPSQRADAKKIPPGSAEAVARARESLRKQLWSKKMLTDTLGVAKEQITKSKEVA